MSLPPRGDTIAAIATAPGLGAIGIVRLSGPDSYRIADTLFRPASGRKPSCLPAGRIAYGRLGSSDDPIDEALLLPFRAPRSYTGEDMVEFQTHGGPAVLRTVLDRCLAGGARLAQPGEFTLRAYLAGRIDLVQAESVLGLVHAQSDVARRNAALGLGQALSRRLGDIQSDITSVYGNIQAVLDYPEEGVEELERNAPLRRALAHVEQLLATAQASRLGQQGARLALIGRPNAGKSSLLNALLGYQRSLVSEVPGTTRDYLEAPLAIAGIPVTAIDTAGLRSTGDAIEASGVALARDIAANADLVLYLLERSSPLDADAITEAARLPAERTLLVASKADLPAAWEATELAAAWRQALPGYGGVPPVIAVSAATGEGLDELRTAIGAALIGDAGASELWLTSERQAEVLRRVAEHLRRALAAPDDLAALDLQAALADLAEVTGRGEIAEETLAHIFANFCVGK